MGYTLFFLFLLKKIDCGYSLEAVLTSTNNLCFEHEYGKYQDFYLKTFSFLVVKFSIYMNRRVFVMIYVQYVKFILLVP